MKHHVPFLDTNAMPWEVGEMPGLFSKMLNANPATGERTALQCIDPARGYKAPTQAHYHPDMDEELYVLKGKMSFDSENWLGANSYCYHPAFTVHGFKSAVASECWFLSRVNAPLTFGFVETPKAVQPYSLMDLEEERAVCVLRDAREGEWTDVRDDSGKVVLRRRVLSRRPSTGEGAMLVEFLPGWVSTHGDHFHSAYEEAFMLSGELVAADGTVFKAGCYSFKPPRTVQSVLKSPNGAMVYINFGGPLDFIPAARLNETELAS